MKRENNTIGFKKKKMKKKKKKKKKKAGKVSPARLVQFILGVFKIERFFITVRQLSL